MGDFVEAVAGFRAALAADDATGPLMRSATALPTEQINAFPALFCYPKGGGWSWASQESVNGLHTLRIALHANRQTLGLDGAFAQLLPYVDEVRRIVLRTWGELRSAGVLTALGGGGQFLRHTWEPDEFGGVPTFSVKFDVELRIDEEV